MSMVELFCAIVVVFVLTSLSGEVVSGANSTRTRELMKKLIHSSSGTYSRRVIPCPNATSPVQVQIAIVVEQINELRDRKQELHWAGFVRVIWNDPSLTWKPKEWSGVEYVFVKENDIWVPDISILERLDDDIGFKDQKRRLLYVTYKGDVKWALGGDLIVTRCPLNIHRFPFDRQTCSMHIGSYSIPADQLQLIDPRQSSYNPIAPENALWSVTGTTSSIVTYTFVNDLGVMDYGYLHFTIHLKRKSTYFVINIIIPLMLISGLMVVTFLLPPDGGEKVSFGITLLLAFNVIQLVMNDTMPQTSENFPVITVYVTALLSMSAILIPLSVLSAYVHRNGCHYFPHFVQRLLKLGDNDVHRMSTDPVLEAYERKSVDSDERKSVDSVTPESSADSLINALRQICEDNRKKLALAERRVRQSDLEETYSDAAMRIDFFFMKLYGFALVMITLGCSIAVIV